MFGFYPWPSINVDVHPVTKTATVTEINSALNLGSRDSAAIASGSVNVLQ